MPFVTINSEEQFYIRLDNREIIVAIRLNESQYPAIFSHSGPDLWSETRSLQ